MKYLTEKDCIEFIKKEAGLSGKRFLGDDTAIISFSPDNKKLITMDTLAEGVHFSFDYYTPYQVGRRLVQVNISDIAAMGGTPKYALLSLGLPNKTSSKNIKAFIRGVINTLKKYHISLVGGDTIATLSGWVVSLTLLGETSKPVTRGGAHPGDIICVSGTLGDSSMALSLLKKGLRNKEIISKHVNVPDRVSLGRWLAKQKIPTAMIDVSDGILDALNELSTESKVGMIVFEGRLPLSRFIINKSKKYHLDAYEVIAGGGEDFELLFTLPEEKLGVLRKRPATLAKIPVSVIGRCLPDREKINWVDINGKKKVRTLRGFDHFLITGRER